MYIENGAKSLKYQIKVKYLTEHLTNAFLCYIFIPSSGSRVVEGPSSENDNRRARQRLLLRTAIPTDIGLLRIPSIQFAMPRTNPSAIDSL